MVPEVSESNPARQCINVDFPEPEGPITAVSCCTREVDGHSVERPDLEVSLAVDLHRVDRAGRNSHTCRIQGLHVSTLRPDETEPKGPWSCGGQEEAGDDA